MEQQNLRFGEQPVQPAGVKELRLALVCYGGVSLAIYMHGITKEFQKLVAASASRDKGLRPMDSSDPAYFDALEELAKKEGGVPTRVVIDIISGTSAGGINGVFLAKAIAQNLSQKALRDLWMQRGDIGQLIDAPLWLRWRPLKYLWFLIKSLKAFGPASLSPPLRGDRMCKWLGEALKSMDQTAEESVKTLVPEDNSLELSVTATDFYGYVQSIPLAFPKAVSDRSHRHVFRFSYDQNSGVCNFEPTATSNAALAFAARATSSFPGAFPPISIEDAEQQMEISGIDKSQFQSDLFRIYELSDLKPRKTFFVDGGVLDNYPFDHAINAIKRKSAVREVTRRLVYLQPDPAEDTREAPGTRPTLFGTVWKAMSGIP